jgi:diguanylate cyclase (GGDEF)-like protein
MASSQSSRSHSDPLNTEEKGIARSMDQRQPPAEPRGDGPYPTAEQLATEHLPAVLLTKQNELDRVLNELNEISNALKSKASPDIQDLSDELMRAVRRAVRQCLLDTELSSLALTDDLTGLHNRRGFLALAHQQLKHANRNSQEVLLFCADLDNLKFVNDSYGHREGDQAIIRTAEALRHTFRNSDILARFGGDEFCVLAMEATRYSERAIQERLKENLRRCNAGETRYSLSLSVGVARFEPFRATTVEELMSEADQKMYEQKRSRHVHASAIQVSGKRSVDG